MEKYVSAKLATDGNIIRRVRFALRVTGYRHIPGTCNTYRFVTATVVAGTRLNFTFIHTMPVLWNDYAQLLQRNGMIIAVLSVRMSEVVELFVRPEP